MISKKGGYIMEYGYIRVSSKEQNIERQMVVVSKFISEKDNVFVDKQSGKNFERPAYKKMMKKLKQGDLIVVKSIDRLGRDYNEILEEWRIITKIKKADILVIDFPLLDTRKKEDTGLTGVFIADLVLQILSYVAQTEREFIHQRQAEGICLAKSRGVKFGRKPIMLPSTFSEIASKFKSKEISAQEAAEMCSMKRSTFYKYIKIFDESEQINENILSKNVDFYELK